MDNASEVLLKLKPVTFKYNSDETGTTQYGLVAEEVAEVAPSLATHDNDGKVQSIRYNRSTRCCSTSSSKSTRKSRNSRRASPVEATVAQQQKAWKS